MDEFTKAERARIDYLYGNDFAGDITSDDVKLISRFESALANQKTRFEQSKKESFEEIRNLQAEAQSAFVEAMNNLNELHARAIDRLDRMEDGK